MGNREDLLTGAKRCLFEKGYARTTSRDIATASGVSLAAIGYHFGSKEALLSAAFQEAITEWGDELAILLKASTDFETAWGKVLESLATSRPLWAIQFELVAHLERHPELRETFTEANRRARHGLAELFRGANPTAGETDAERIGACYQVLLTGLAAEWLVDPDSTPSGADLLAALRTIAAS
jgi:AcrR family transcriptional regulator